MRFWNSISPITKFVILFLVMLVIVSVIFSQLFTRFHDNMLWLMKMTTSIAGWTLTLFTNDASYSGVNIVCRNFTLEIIDECTGLFEMLIFIAASFVVFLGAIAIYDLIQRKKAAKQQ